MYRYVMMREYALTATLRPKMFMQSNKDQYKESVTVLYAKLHHICDRFYVTTELTKDNNVHYHGIIRVLKKYSLFTPQDINREMRKLLARTKIGFIKIVPLYDKPKWIRYMTKEDISNVFYDVYYGSRYNNKNIKGREALNLDEERETPKTVWDKLLIFSQ